MNRQGFPKLTVHHSNFGQFLSAQLKFMYGPASISPIDKRSMGTFKQSPMFYYLMFQLNNQTQCLCSVVGVVAGQNSPLYLEVMGRRRVPPPSVTECS